ncbi:hypothetical protein BSKO_09175 [Bryopsis sp. KO-2023]|nr:hypothetical protein BSKO_09175 [Bryopsis sp. KO-2023]
MDVERAVVRTSRAKAARNMRTDDQSIYLEELLRECRDLSPCEELFGGPDFAVSFEDKSAARDRPNCNPQVGDHWSAGAAFQTDRAAIFPFDAGASAARGKKTVSAGRAERLVMDRRDTVESTSTVAPPRKRKALHIGDLEPERDSQDDSLVKQEGPYFLDFGGDGDVFGGGGEALIGDQHWGEPTFAESCLVALSRSSVRTTDFFGAAEPSAYQQVSIDGVGIPPTSSNDNSWGAGVPDVGFSDVKTSPNLLFETIDTGSFEQRKLTVELSTFNEPWIPVHPRRAETGVLGCVGSNSSLATPLFPETAATPPFCPASPGKEAPADDDNEETEEDQEFRVGEEESKSSSTGAEDQSGGGEPESLVPRRRSRRRVHPTAKFRGEEVCWTPDDKDETEDEEIGESPRKGTRSNRSRGGNRGKHRRSRWDGADGSRRRKPHNPWTLDETRALVRGVEKCGGGKWADIKRLGLKEIGSRTPVDLKDKWRNLLRVALLPPEQMRLKKIDRRQDLPMEILQRVKELAQNKTTKRSPSTNLMHCKMAKISH